MQPSEAQFIIWNDSLLEYTSAKVSCQCLIKNHIYDKTSLPHLDRAHFFLFYYIYGETIQTLRLNKTFPCMKIFKR